MGVKKGENGEVFILPRLWGAEKNIGAVRVARGISEPEKRWGEKPLLGHQWTKISSPPPFFFSPAPLMDQNPSFPALPTALMDWNPFYFVPPNGSECFSSSPSNSANSTESPFFPALLMDQNPFLPVLLMTTTLLEQNSPFPSPSNGAKGERSLFFQPF